MFKAQFLVFIVIFIGFNLYSQEKTLISGDDSFENQMIFLTYHIQKSGDNLEITYIKNSIAEGRIKGYSQEKQHDELGNLECTILDKDFKILETLFIENPLKKVVEFVNDSGDLEKRMIERDKTDFTFRMPFPDKAKYVRMQLLSNSETQKFIVTKL
jgi:hypothetical protein